METFPRVFWHFLALNTKNSFLTETRLVTAPPRFQPLDYHKMGAAQTFVVSGFLSATTIDKQLEIFLL
jgi:hypothetical protein